MRTRFLKSYFLCFEGEPGTGQPQPAGAILPTNVGGGANGGANLPAGKVFTQAEVNELIAKDKRTLRLENEKLVAQLESLKQNNNLSAQEKEDLQSRIDQLTAMHQTEAQTKDQELTRLKKQSDTLKTTLESERDGWRSRYERTLVGNEVASASIEFKAFNPSQIEALIAPMTKVVEEIGADAKPTGKFITQVSFVGEDKDGKPINLTLSVKDAVKAMTQLPEKYGNLFRAEGAGGVGVSPNGGPTSSRMPSLENMTPEQYRQNRTKIRSEMANTRG